MKPDPTATGLSPNALFVATCGAASILAAVLSSGCEESRPEEPVSSENHEETSQNPSALRNSTKSLEHASPPARGKAPPSHTTPSDLPRGLLVTYAQFDSNNRPQAARLEMITRQGGTWQVEAIEDQESNVFHKAMVLGGNLALDDAPSRSGKLNRPKQLDPSGIVTLGGMGAAVKLWRRAGDAWQAKTLWSKDFGGRFNRMRDAEIADLDGDGLLEIAVGTHDQGVVAILDHDAKGNWAIRELDRQADTFIHEIELGDLDGDGTLEIYATPSEPNTLGGGEQHGEVVRYSPGDRPVRTTVADLGNRHAKEIWVGDADGDGRDELYVAVEALTAGEGSEMRIVEEVEIRRYDADTAPTDRVVVARIRDRFNRFLTVGDPDGDGTNAMVAASFRAGLWLIEPGSNPREEWAVSSIDRNSGGFEHAAYFTDLDGDGRDELYVGSDAQGELRRYVWVNGKARSEVILKWSPPRSRMTWNITAAPRSML
ncbi:MAG: VCBS repeat-containing protein [Myxococcota bacterium]